jgi:hypothetical protein
MKNLIIDNIQRKDEDLILKKQLNEVIRDMSNLKETTNIKIHNYEEKISALEDSLKNKYAEQEKILNFFENFKSDLEKENKLHKDKIMALESSKIEFEENNKLYEEKINILESSKIELEKKNQFFEEKILVLESSKLDLEKKYFFCNEKILAFEKKNRLEMNKNKEESLILNLDQNRITYCQSNLDKNLKNIYLDNNRKIVYNIENCWCNLKIFGTLEEGKEDALELLILNQGGSDKNGFCIGLLPANQIFECKNYFTFNRNGEIFNTSNIMISKEIKIGKTFGTGDKVKFKVNPKNGKFSIWVNNDEAFSGEFFITQPITFAITLYYLNQQIEILS